MHDVSWWWMAFWAVLTFLVIAAVIFLSPAGRRRGAVATAVVIGAIALVIVRRAWFGDNAVHFLSFRPITRPWMWWLIAAAVAAFLLMLVRGTVRGVARLGAAVVLMLALLAPFNWANTAQAKPTAAQSSGATTTTQPPVTDEWTLHYYYQDPGVPQGYFGLALVDCKPGTGDVQKCKADIIASLKHDPNILTAKMRDFHLLDDFFGQPEDQFYGQSPEQIEAKRQEAAKKLEDVNLRKQWEAKVEAVYDSMSNLHLEEFSGPYHTEFVDQNGQIHQAEKTMNPADNYGMTGTLPDGSTHTDKADCHIQGVSKQPLPNVPEQPTPHGTTTTQPQVTTTTQPHVTTTTQPHTTTTLKCPQQEGAPNGTQCIPNDSIPRQPVQDNPQGPTPGAGGPPPSQPTNNNSNPQTAPNPNGSDTGSTSGGQQGTTKGPDGTTSGSSTPGQGGGTQTPATTPAESQPTNSGMPPEPAAYQRPNSTDFMPGIVVGLMIGGIAFPISAQRTIKRRRRITTHTR